MYNQPTHKTEESAIESELKKVQKVSNNKNLTTKNLKGHYNCWGFTAFVYNWLSELKWFEFREMEYCLAHFTRRVKNPKAGDIVAFWDEFGDIIHTSILTETNSLKIIHKPGYLKLEVNTVGGAVDIYEDTFDTLTFNRPLKNKTFDYKKFWKSDFNDYYND